MQPATSFVFVLIFATYGPTRQVLADRQRDVFVSTHPCLRLRFIFVSLTSSVSAPRSLTPPPPASSCFCAASRHLDPQWSALRGVCLCSPRPTTEPPLGATWIVTGRGAGELRTAIPSTMPSINASKPPKVSCTAVRLYQSYTWYSKIYLGRRNRQLPCRLDASSPKASII